MINEVFAQIKGLEGYFDISNFGRIKSVNRTIIRSDGRSMVIKERIRKVQKNNSGYEVVILKLKRKELHFTVHRLVAMSFLKNENNYPEVNHKDGNKLNNHFDNLEWATKSLNNLHAYRSGLRKCRDMSGKNNPNYKSGKYIGT